MTGLSSAPPGLQLSLYLMPEALDVTGPVAAQGALCSPIVMCFL